MNRKTLSEMTREQLIDLARRKKIHVTTRLNKTALVSTISKELSKRERARKKAGDQVKIPSTATKTKTGKKKSTPSTKGKHSLTDRDRKDSKGTSTVPSKSATKSASKTKPRKKVGARSSDKTLSPPDRKPKKAPGRSLTKTRKKAVKIQPPPRIEEDLAAKFILGEPKIHDEARREQTPELPSGYGDHCLVVLPRDPFWIYLYWELQEERVQHILANSGIDRNHAEWRVQVQALETHRNQILDTYLAGVDIRTGSWYLNLAAPGQTFRLDLGVIDAYGKFVSVVSSDLFTLPRNHPSAQLDEEWIGTDAEWEHHYGSFPEDAHGRVPGKEGDRRRGRGEPSENDGLYPNFSSHNING